MAYERMWQPKGTRLDMSLSNVKTRQLKELSALVSAMQITSDTNDPESFDKLYQKYKDVSYSLNQLGAETSRIDRIARDYIGEMVRNNPERYAK